MTYLEVEVEMMKELDDRAWVARKIRTARNVLWASRHEIALSIFNDPERNLQENVEVYPRDFDMRYADED